MLRAADIVDKAGLVLVRLVEALAPVDPQPRAKITDQLSAQRISHRQSRETLHDGDDVACVLRRHRLPQLDPRARFGQAHHRLELPRGDGRGVDRPFLGT